MNVFFTVVFDGAPKTGEELADIVRRESRNLETVLYDGGRGGYPRVIVARRALDGGVGIVDIFIRAGETVLFLESSRSSFLGAKAEYSQIVLRVEMEERARYRPFRDDDGRVTDDEMRQFREVARLLGGELAF